jgi:SNF2 family DNA or RNA helicase
MKTQPMKHQLEALYRMNNRDHYALFMDRGTGKTWTFLADAERLYCSGRIDGLLVVAPKGVHTNWVLREIPVHLEAPHIARAWTASTAKRSLRHMEEVLRPRADDELRPLRIFTINADALIHKRGFEFSASFINAMRACAMVVDESDLIKNPRSARTKAITKLGRSCAVRRIGTGTPATNSPLDLFAQMEFLESGLLGTTSFAAFTAEHAELLHEKHPLVENIMRQAAQRGKPLRAAPQVVARDANGAPRWRNMERLRARIEPHSYRITKEECLDLPPKIYKTTFFDLTPAQRAVYDAAEADMRVMLEDGGIATFTGSALGLKLQQITSGFLITKDGTYSIEAAAPRLEALMTQIDITPPGEQIIIWARFREELRHIAEALRQHGETFVEYHGAVPDDEREAAVDDFQKGTARIFLGQPQSGGVGLTLTAASNVFYYSNDYNSRTRLQSEDRAHRVGTKRSVLYVDLAAERTIDEEIAAAHQRKVSVERALMDSERLSFASVARDNYDPEQKGTEENA